MRVLTANATYLADAEAVGEVIGRLMFPVAGLVMVIIGIVLLVRSRTRKAPPGYPPPPMWQQPYPPPGQAPPPPGYYAAPPPGYYQQPPNPYPYNSFGSPPPVKRGSRKTTGTVLLVVGIVLLASSVASAATRISRSEDALAVGHCAAEVGDSPSDFKAISCDDPTAIVEVASHSENNTCPDGKAADGGESNYGSATNGSTTYCFIPNLREGRCYTIDPSGEKISDAACSAPRAVRIVKRADGSTNESTCGPGTKALSFPTPARVYCVAKAS